MHRVVPVVGLALVCLALPVAPARAQDSVEDRLERLEPELEAQRAENEGSSSRSRPRN